MRKILHNKKAIISETYQRPDKSQLLEPPELADLINTKKLSKEIYAKTNRYRQIFENHTKKCVKRHTPPCNHKRDTSGIFKQSTFQRYIPIFSTKYFPSSKSARCKVEVLAEMYILIDLQLIKLIKIPVEETALWAIPEMCAGKIITFYHSSLFVGHQSIIKI